MNILCRNTVKLTCWSRPDSVCGSRTEAMQKYIELTGGHTSYKWT